VVAHELADRRVAVQVRVTSQLARHATISSAQLAAPAGYDVQPQPPELAALLPLQARACALGALWGKGACMLWQENAGGCAALKFSSVCQSGRVVMRPAGRAFRGFCSQSF
jgi:hypothetical protein